MNRTSFLLVLALLAPPLVARAAKAPQRCQLQGPSDTPVILTMPPGAGQLHRHCRSLQPFVQQAPAAIETSLRALDIVKDVHCGLRASPKEVHCALTPHVVVRNYSLFGSWPWSLFGDDIRRRISLRSGTRIDELEPALQAQSERLRTYLGQEGFVDAAVSTVAHLRPSHGLEQAVDIEVALQVKRALRVRRVEVQGSAVLPTEELAAPFFHRNLFGWQSRFRPAAVRDDQDRAERRLAELGYIGSRVDVEIDRHPEAGAVDLTLTVRAGRKVALDIEGHGPLSRRSVARLAPFAQAGSVDGATAQNYREAIRRAYQEKGYVDARVDVTLVPQGDNAITVRVRIEPQARASVYAISYRHIPAPLLREARMHLSEHQKRNGTRSKRAWVDVDVEHDSEALAARLREMGFAEARVTPQRIDDGARQRLCYDIALGVRERVGRLVWRGLPPSIDADSLLASLLTRPRQPYSSEAVERDRQSIAVALLRAGFAEADVVATTAPGSNEEAGAKDAMRQATCLPRRTVDVIFEIAAQERSVFAGVWPQGNFRTRQSTLAHEMPLKLEAPLDLVAMGTARRSLRGLNIFHNVQLTPSRPLAQDKRTWLLLRLEERDVRTLDGLVGFSSDFLFSVGADWRDANWLGRAIVFNAQARLSDASNLVPRLRIGNQDLLQVDLRAPHPLGLPLSADAQAQYRLQDVRDFRERRIGVTAGVTRMLLRRSQCRFCVDVSARLAYELQEAYRVDKLGADGPSVERNVTIARLVPSLDVDRRDSRIDPKRGGHLNIRLEGAHPDLAPSTYLHRRATRFWRALLSAQAFVPLGTPPKISLGARRALGGPWVLALSANYGVAQPYGRRDEEQSAVPASETFGYGGDLSVRGLYARASSAQLANPLFLAVVSAELRVYFLEDIGIGSLQLAGFVDAGTVAMQAGALFEETTVSAGPALRYVTPIGPLSLAYGRALLVPAALHSGPGAAPRHGRVHFTFGYTF